MTLAHAEIIRVKLWQDDEYVGEKMMQQESERQPSSTKKDVKLKGQI